MVLHVISVVINCALSKTYSPDVFSGGNESPGHFLPQNVGRGAILEMQMDLTDSSACIVPIGRYHLATIGLWSMHMHHDWLHFDEMLQSPSGARDRTHIDIRTLACMKCPSFPVF